MDLAKALGILGFNSTRWLDRSSFNPKAELDKAHFKKMMEIMDKKKADEKGDNKKDKPPEIKYTVKGRKELTPDDQVRILHEAYQYLLKKYNLGVEQVSETPLVSPFMKLELDEPPKKYNYGIEEDNDKGM